MVVVSNRGVEFGLRGEESAIHGGVIFFDFTSNHRFGAKECLDYDLMI